METKSGAHDRLAIAALLTAGLGWGTTGLFVRTIGAYGHSVYELLFLRLLVTGLVILPVLLVTLAKTPRKIALKPTVIVGFSMVFYYLGAIQAFTHLPMIIAALIIGSSPLMAWLLPLILERRGPRGRETKQGAGVLVAVLGLLLLLVARAPAPGKHLEHAIPMFGYIGAFVSAIVTVLNARYLNRMGKAAPKPFEITMATVFAGLAICAFLISDWSALVETSQIHLAPVLGFGILATAIPGIAIAYASVRLPPQATATVSIQLQVWAGALAWIILGESMTIFQVLAATFIIAGSWICVRAPVSNSNI